MRSFFKKSRGSLTVCVFFAVLAMCDYFLFREFELVWPFFWMPYAVMLIIYLAGLKRDACSSAVAVAIHLFVIIPVFAGLVMSLAWMAKIDFWGEQLRGIFV